MAKPRAQFTMHGSFSQPAHLLLYLSSISLGLGLIHCNHLSLVSVHQTKFLSLASLSPLSLQHTMQVKSSRPCPRGLKASGVATPSLSLHRRNWPVSCLQLCLFF
ncbi:hypothetical protein V6N12_070766 [Hibiscus sabdariffa]|uniref:Uncharacterized protein n=1 Tax=Hibiscus sabdariffa TaxID=183260 RepID=A0ABR2FHS6_9ROSI